MFNNLLYNLIKISVPKNLYHKEIHNLHNHTYIGQSCLTSKYTYHPQIYPNIYLVNLFATSYDIAFPESRIWKLDDVLPPIPG